MKLSGFTLALALLVPACSRSPHPAYSTVPAQTSAAGEPKPTPAAPAVQAAAPSGPVIGAPRVIENLTIFPIAMKDQTDIGPITTLDAALAKGAAEVRELGSDGRATGEGPQVNTLAIENKGEVPIYVLAGTVVKGGRQDRQIGQDVVIESKQAVPVDAFCVEHGRWTAQRDGHDTGGKFGTVQELAPSEVRAAGQYKKNQAEVWSKVEAANEANKKTASSGTLMATLDDAEIAQKRAAIATKLGAFLDGVEPNGDTVGFAYAIDGKVKGVRWFANHRVFVLFEKTLVNTAAVDAITAQAQAIASGKPLSPPVAMAPGDVTHFMEDVDRAQVSEERDTRAANQNEVKETPKAYGTKTMLKGAPAQSAPRKPISSDYLSK
jgi:hypothetical protein